MIQAEVVPCFGAGAGTCFIWGFEVFVACCCLERAVRAVLPCFGLPCLCLGVAG